MRLLPLTLLVSACTALRPVTADDLRGPTPVDRVRVTLVDHATVDLYDPKVVGDTLKGIVEDWNGPDHRQFLLSQTTAIRAREAAPERTAELVFWGAAAAFTVFVVEKTQRRPVRLPCVDDCPGCCT